MPISVRKTSNHGFTLIELIVVIALMAVITLLAVPGISSFFKVSLSTATTQMASIIKEAYNSAVITGKVHRVVYDLDKKEYWVESGPKTFLLESEQSRKEKEKLGRKKEITTSSEFTQEKRITRKKQSLPLGVKFVDIITEQSSEKITEGRAYTHIFPHGMAERTLIHLEDNGNHQITLNIRALSGRTKQFDGYLDAKQVTE